ncbi:MAG TPA: formate dehydrogenase accessory protein FdhE [Bryobacteraceae bacterium]|jgi:formate dehydrogenase maturation protein FdhE|nr:formate dehydrogenase accessory protein FdhE [Bryobacteraceae bacterium]
MVSSEDRRIRAKLLSKKYPESAHLLEFYIQITELQDDIAADFPDSTREPADWFPRLAALVPQIPFPPTGEAEEFFWRIVKQPYAEYFREPGEGAGPTCPSCGSKPVVGVLRGEGDGAKRSLICSLCGLEWPYRRLICANCGEEDKGKLPVFVAAGIEHVRVEACDTCRTYLKSVDLTKDGFAVPVVDEIATVALNLWADEQGYTKIETNVLGM